MTPAHLFTAVLLQAPKIHRVSISRFRSVTL